MNTNLKGLSATAISSITFGTIALFSLPVLKSGMDSLSLIVYRFFFGGIALLLLALFQRVSLRVSLKDIGQLLLLSCIYSVSALSLIEGYNYMPTGVATTLVFSYPVWTALLMAVFFRERLGIKTIASIVLAIVGVVLLSGITGSDLQNSHIGVAWELLSGLTYAIYLVVFPRLEVKKMPSLALTFYIFLFTMLLILGFSFITKGELAPIANKSVALNLVLVGLIPTAISNTALIVALKKVSSTMAAILGAFEPVTAMLVGVLVFSEPFTVPIAIGLMLIIASVIFLVLSNKKAQEQDKRIEEEA